MLRNTPMIDSRGFPNSVCKTNEEKKRFDEGYDNINWGGYWDRPETKKICKEIKEAAAKPYPPDHAIWDVFSGGRKDKYKNNYDRIFGGQKHQFSSNPAAGLQEEYNKQYASRVDKIIQSYGEDV